MRKNRSRKEITISQSKLAEEQERKDKVDAWIRILKEIDAQALTPAYRKAFVTKDEST
jgi:hypothetical protein